MLLVQLFLQTVSSKLTKLEYVLLFCVPIQVINVLQVPQYFAETLTYKQPVTAFNYKEMAQLVINGTKYPGALIVEDEFGVKTVLVHTSIIHISIILLLFIIIELVGSNILCSPHSMNKNVLVLARPF